MFTYTKQALLLRYEAINQMLGTFPVFQNYERFSSNFVIVTRNYGIRCLFFFFLLGMQRASVKKMFVIINAIIRSNLSHLFCTEVF